MTACLTQHISHRTDSAAMTKVRRADTAVLVLRALGLGDAVTGVAALRGVRRAFPDRWIMLAGPSSTGTWLRSLGLVDEALPASGLQRLRWPPAGLIGDGGHIAVNLHGRGPQSHRLLDATCPESLIAFAEAPVPTVSTGRPPWRADEHEVDRWCRLVRSAGGACGRDDLRLPRPDERGDTIVVHPGAASASRRWPATRWIRLVVDLAERGHPLVLTGSVHEKRLCASIVAGAMRHVPSAAISSSAGRLDVPALAEVIATARLLVSGDTGVAHLATAYATSSVVLFGPTSPSRWGPAIDPDLHAVLWHGAGRSPGDPHGRTLDPALDRIGVPEVLDAALTMARRR